MMQLKDPNGQAVEPAADFSVPVLNIAELLARTDNDRDLLRELLSLFKEESTNLLISLKEAASCRQMEQVATAAHTLKGMLASLSATRAASAAARIEEVGRSETVSELDVVLAAFDVEMTRLLPKVDSYLLES
jgi:HPt (histidine-containing phosphotransfer) domain-containing protein